MYFGYYIALYYDEMLSLYDAYVPYVHANVLLYFNTRADVKLIVTTG